MTVTAGKPSLPPTPPGATGQRRKRAITFGLYLLFLCTDVGFSHWDELFGHEQCDLVKARLWYQRVVTLGYRKPQPHFVRLVTVTPPHDDACGYRLLLAKLLGRITESKPLMIVLDYSFSPHDCGEKTQALRNAIQSAASQAPLVFGLASSTLREVDDRHKPELQPLKDAGFGPNDQAIWPSDVPADGVSTVTGLYRLDCDTRRIPTYWSVFEKKDGRWIHHSQPMATIALVAASLYDPSVKNRPQLNGRENPFTSFISEERFNPVEASDILRENGNPAEWQFQRRIVVIGDAVGDKHDTVVGWVPGVVLQANYLESLLDDRYFIGLSTVCGTVATFVCLLVIGVVFDKTEEPNRAFFRTAFFLLFLFSMSYFALVHFARLFTFWAPCVPAIPAAYLAQRHG